MTFDARYDAAVNEICRHEAPGFAEMRAFCLGEGKRLRPELLLDAVSAWGGDKEAATQAAIGVELLHHFFLIHDDIMDGDELRRGQPTLHAGLSQRLGASSGTGLALALGDYLVNEALRYFMAGAKDAERQAALAGLFAEITRETIQGQISEYVGRADWTLVKLEEFYAYKTAAYSIRLPWLAADILAGSSMERAEHIASVSRELGVAYQIHDDLIEFTGQKKRSAEGGGDIARGKMTVISRLLLDRLPMDKKESLLAMWRRGEALAPEKIEELKTFAIAQGILAEVGKMIADHIQKALPGIEALKIKDAPSLKRLIDHVAPPTA